MSNSIDTIAIERKIRAKATRRTRAKLGLVWHFAIFAITNLALFEIDLNYTPTIHWFVWPLCAWTVGLLFHAFGALSGGGLSEDMIQREIEKERRRRGLA
jgi:hypothetical protein